MAFEKEWTERYAENIDLVIIPRNTIKRRYENKGIDLIADGENKNSKHKMKDVFAKTVGLSLTKNNKNLALVCDELTTILKVSIPLGGFYLWPRIPHSDIDFARELYTRENVKVLPGSYLSRDFHGV